MAQTPAEPATTIKAPAQSSFASPLFLDGLLEFTRVKWGIASERVRLSDGVAPLPAVETVFYLDQRGRIRAPRLSPYIPVAFEPTPTGSLTRLDRQWVQVGGLLAEEMRRRGFAHMVALAPEVSDVRPFSWAGFNVDMRYVFHLELPHQDRTADSSVRKQMAKATRAGYRVERTSRMEDVNTCLRASQERQRFQMDMDAADYALAQDIMGEDALRAYVCYAPDGEPASARVVLHHPGTRAIDWAAGVNSAHLTAGANQLLIGHMLDDLHEAGATAFDFSDAELGPVAAMKASWGGQLVPIYTVDGGRARAVARRARDYWHQRRQASGSRAGNGGK